MVGHNTQRDDGPKDGPARGRPGQTPPPKSRPARLRVIGLVGADRIAATFKAVWRIWERTWAAAVGAAAGLGRSLAGFVRGLAGFASGLMRRDAIAAVVAVAAAAAAVFAWGQSVDTETRQISSELLNRFNSDEMWKARLTLERYYYLLSGDRIAPADLARLTEEYFKSFVYQKVAPAAGRLTDRVKFGGDRERQEDFLRQVDQSRSRVKNFYEDIIVFSESRLITNALKEKVLKSRFYRNTGDFLECFWLPVELGQNAALYQGRKADNDKRACQVVDWYREKLPVAGRPATPCVPYAARQPDFCVDPRVEAQL